MDTSIVISVLALAVSIASAWYSRVQAQLKKQEHERQAHILQVNVDKSVSDDVHTGLRITNSGHSPVYLKSVTLRQRELSWTTDWLAKELQPNGDRTSCTSTPNSSSSNPA